MKKIPSGFLNTQTDSSTGFTPVVYGLLHHFKRVWNVVQKSISIGVSPAAASF